MSDYQQAADWWRASDGLWYPPNAAVPAAPEPMLLSIGDIAIYPTRVVTPSGVFPHSGLTWVMRDNSVTTEGMPAYAIVLAILFFFVCLLGLLFLLIKERKTQGYVDVSVQSPDGRYHVTQIPVSSPEQVAAIRHQVDYARGLVQW